MKLNNINNVRSCIVVLSILLPAWIYAQVNVKLSGNVTDVTGQALIGVNVIISGTNLGTVTDVDGTYILTGRLEPGIYNLQISYVGYTNTVVGITVEENGLNRSQDVTLQEDILNLDEIVVTGNSPTATRKQLGNSIAVVRGDNIQGTGSNNVLGALSGKVMGAQITQNSGDPSGGFTIRMRGSGTILGSSDPLYVVDGVIVDNSSQNVVNLSADAMTTGFQSGQNRLVDINPNDIERIEVLNGASAAAIYGSRAANGVVQIFTKRGTSGKPKIEFNASMNFNRLRKKVFMSDFPQRFGIKGNDRLETAQDRLTTLLTVGLTEQQIKDKGGNYIITNPGNRILITDKYNVTRYDYQDDIFQPSFGTDNYLSISGGNEKSNYFASFGYSNNDGIIPNTNFTKLTGRLRFNQTINKWLIASAGLAYNFSKSKDLPNGNNFFSPISTMFIIDNVWDINERDANGNLKQVEQVRMNPLSVIETFDITQRTNRTIGDVQFKLFPIKGLTAEVVFGVDNYSLVGNEFHPRVPYAGVSAAFFPDGYISAANSQVTLANHDLNITYNTELGLRINSTTTAGYQIQYSRSSFQAQEGRDLAPFVSTLSGANNIFTRPSQSIAQRMVNGYFLQQTFGYDEQLYLTLAGRVDGSTAFSPENQFNFFPKASLSWLISRLFGSSSNSLLNLAKIRASYGEAGNLTGIGPYDRYNNFFLGSYTGFTSITPSSTLANPDVKPERKKEMEVGFDLALFKNRIGLNFSYYNQNIVDLLLQRQLPPTAGGTSIVTNIGGSMRNKGIEFMLTANVVKQKDFSWDLGLNWSQNRNEVSGIDGILALRGSDGTQSVLNGEQFGVFFGRYYARDNNGNLLLTAQGLAQPERGIVIPASKYNEATLPSGALKDRIYQYAGSFFIPMRDGNGQPLRVAPAGFAIEELRKVIGDPNPDWIGSLSTNFRYKKISLGILFDSYWGADVYNWNRITSNNVGFGELAEKELKGEVARGYVASVAGGVTGQRIQEEHIEDGSFIKLRELSFSYNLGKLGGFENFTIGLQGRNLISFDSYQGFDPETNSAGQNDRVRGDDFGNVPIPMSFQFKINTRF